VAVISALPPLTAVTRPALETVATAVFDDCQLACDVTLCVVPFDNVAVAVNCALPPTAGAVPVTDTDATLADAVGVDEVGELAQAATIPATTTAPTRWTIADRSTFAPTARESVS